MVIAAFLALFFFGRIVAAQDAVETPVLTQKRRQSACNDPNVLLRHNGRKILARIAADISGIVELARQKTVFFFMLLHGISRKAPGFTIRKIRSASHDAFPAAIFATEGLIR